MRTPVALVLLTTTGFGVGLGTGYWMNRNCKLAPPPPSSVLSEFRNITRAGTALALSTARPELWAEINAELEKLRPEMDAFRGKLEEMDGEFRTQFEAFLSPEQRKKLAEIQPPRREANRDSAKAKESAKEPAKDANPPAPGAPAAPATPKPSRVRLGFESEWLVSQLVFVPCALERYTYDLALDATQQARLRELLLERRKRFIELADATPPPSMQLLRIADIIRRAQTEEKK
jgi:hypothetical protein